MQAYIADSLVEAFLRWKSRLHGLQANMPTCTLDTFYEMSPN